MRKQQFTALMYGWIIVLGLILLASFILAFLLRFTTFNEPTLSWVALVIGLISLFIGGMVAGVKGKAKGWIIGAITGLGFTLFTFLVQYLGYQQAFSLEQSVHHIGYILAALFGGVVGVNIIGSTSSD
ncbi:TIGR04086 family membrane protein [Virgibacillus sp. C22-A2]|uniref:TIGR04086 family membrane protein n=1 Tax=Virgibacillus tibetensis TaxID=3042313 RepID=A0ABU6KAB9_9BACI|nr:TIGR04086 family membrane protein [Virgibacillus sp. C22-A2]